MIRKCTIIVAFAAGSLAGCSQLEHREQVEQATAHWNQIRARVKLQLAQRSFQTAAVDDALKHCTDVLSLDPELTDAHLLMARIRLELGQVTLAENALIQASAIDPDNSDVLYLRAHLAERKNQHAEAAEFYRQAYELKSGDINYLLACVESLIAADRYSDALDMLMTRRADFEQNPAIYLLTGQAYELMGRPNEAADAYLKAIDLVPADELLRETAGLALIAAGRATQALDLLKPAGDSTVDSLPPGLARILAEALLKNARTSDAISLLRRATRNNENEVSLWLLLAKAYMTADQFELAGPALNEAVSRDPDHVEARLLLAYHALATDDVDAAVLGAQQILNQHPNDVQARAILARALECDPARAQLAAEHYRHIISLDSTHPWARDRIDALASIPAESDEQSR